MPTYHVNVKRTHTTTYDEIEIEADDKDEAQRLAQEMVEDEEISPDSDDVTHTFETTEATPE